MRKILLAMSVAALATPACAQGMPPLNLLRDKPPPSAEEVKREQAIDKAYKNSLSQIPARKSDPWGNVRGAEQKPGKPVPRN